MNYNDKLHNCNTLLAKLLTRSLIQSCRHVGSGAVLNDTSNAKDIDFICKVKSFKDFEKDLELPEFSKLANVLKKEINSDYEIRLPIMSYRLTMNDTDLNLIIIESETFYEAYKLATEIQIQYALNITDKEERINFHQTFIKHYYNSHKTDNEINYFPGMGEAKDIFSEKSLEDLV